MATSDSGPIGDRYYLIPGVACPVDPEDHRLFASLGSATQDMVEAAPALGLQKGGRLMASRW